MAKLVLSVLLAALCIRAEPASAKRAAPKPVKPVTYRGITYTAPNLDVTEAYVVASDPKGKELFRIRVFEVPIDPKLEQDIQWIFITHLKPDGDSLLVGDEKGRCFAIALTAHAVKRKCGCAF
jgi:hypothetical protein